MNELPEKDPLVAKWVGEIERYEKQAEKWLEKSRKIIERYTDERKGTSEDKANRFNALWANVQSLQPSLYIKLPNPQVERRYLDADKTGRVASEVLQRAISFSLNHEVHQTYRQNILDYLLVGLGITWIRYVPHFSAAIDEVADDGVQVYQNAEAEDSITWEEAAIDYVHYRDFGHTEARTWSEVKAVWRKAFMTREQLRDRFPEHADEIPLNFGLEERKDDPDKALKDDKVKKAVIYEIWDKDSKKAIWVSKNYPKVLDEKDDPLELEGFFPCPRPLFATVTNNSLIPIPDYVLYQDQALELDDLSQRISGLNRAIKVAGVYDKNCDGVQRILNEGVENQLIAVDNWAMFAEKGGLKGAIDWLPLADIVSARTELERAFESTKAKMDEITGMIDIKRGDTNANETATAQQLKSNYSNIRLRDRQAEAQRFIRDNIVIVGQVIAGLFQTETLKAITGLKLLDMPSQKEVLLQQIQQGAALAAMQQKPAPPVPDELQQLLDQPTWTEVVDMLRDKATRNFRIDIETDSTIQPDEQQEKTQRMELLAGLTNAMEKLVPIAQENPMLAPLIGEMVLFGVRSFRVGRPFESRIEEIITKMEKAAQNPAPQKPSPEAIKAQAEQAKAQASAQSDAAKMAHEKEKMVLEMQMEQARNQMAAQLEQITQAAQMEHTRMQNEMESQRLMLQHELDTRSAQMEGQIKLMIEQAKQEAAREKAEQSNGGED